MRLTHEDFDHTTVVRVHGDLSADDVNTFRKLIEDRLSQQTRDFVLDLSEMDTLDSQGLESMLWLQERCGEKLGQVRLAGVSAHTEKVLEVTRLLPRFDRHPDVESALKSLRI